MLPRVAVEAGDNILDRFHNPYLAHILTQTFLQYFLFPFMITLPREYASVKSKFFSIFCFTLSIILPITMSF